jgi:four helix bundle protein
MKRSKRQDPSPRETSISKDQPAQLAVPSKAWWEDEQNDDAQVLKDEPIRDPANRHPFDLEERTAVFGEDIVRFAKKVPRHPANDRLIDQVVGCGTSVGGNYCEANEGVSKKDFRHPISRCVKEAKETKFFLRMIVASEPQMADQARPLYREANELLLIFASMYRK